MYDDAKPKPAAKLIDDYNEFDDFTLVPYDKEKLFDKVDQSITLDLKMDVLSDGAN